MDAGAELRELYEQYAARIYTYCVRVTGSADDAADALQDTFTSVYGRLRAEAAQPIEHPRAYLFAVARRACLRRIEERRRVDVVSEPPEPGTPDALTDAETRVLTRDLQSEVRAANRRLPVRQREVLVLREVERLSYAEIGTLMELEPNAVAQLAWRARLGLRAALRSRALASIAPASKACERALGLLALAEDGPLPEADACWLDEHLEECPRCAANRAAMLEAGTTYRAWTPIAAAPIAAMLVAERAEAAVGGGRRRRGGRAPALAGGAALVLATVGSLIAGAAELADPGDPPRAPAQRAAATRHSAASSLPAGAAQPRAGRRRARRRSIAPDVRVPSAVASPAVLAAAGPPVGASEPAPTRRGARGPQDEELVAPPLPLPPVPLPPVPLPPLPPVPVLEPPATVAAPSEAPVEPPPVEPPPVEPPPAEPPPQEEPPPQDPPEDPRPPPEQPPDRPGPTG